MLLRCLRRLVRLVWLWCWPLAAAAQGLPVTDLALLVDADGSQTIASVTAPQSAARFRPLDGLVNHIMKTDKAFGRELLRSGAG